MVNLYFVESPIQLSSAIKLNSELGGKSHLFVNLGPRYRKANYKQMQDQIFPESWGAITYLRPGGDYIFKFLYAILIMAYIKFKYFFKDKKVCIGEFRNIFFAYMTFISNERYILLDDGAVTVNLQLSLFKYGKGILSYYKKRKYKFLLNLVSLFNFKHCRDLPPNLYSFFDLDVHLSDGQKNFYQKEPKKNKSLMDNVFFFGSKYSESNLISVNDELLCLSEVFNFLKCKHSEMSVKYIMHRDESEGKIELIKDIGFDVVNLKEGSELFFEKSEQVPKVIAGFYSTAIYSTYAIYNIEYSYSFDFSSKLVSTEIVENIKHVYDYYDSVGIERIILV
ncbi:hypothetical protein [Aliivibrio fischeri]|uniref:hypothetical protein n=1 Tax=Aliivibrio fischeri TaxID=668 RepID=UPI0012D90592|nr:hypothetical protein [Aliivibrio fischeri]MUI52482.1 hypothetical protein [Aliivibrio fischeri]